MQGGRTALKVLHLEDNAKDAKLVKATLAGAGIACDFIRVECEADFVRELENSDIDVILSDFSLPGFDGTTALSIASGIRPDIPFIFVSGTIGEEAAIDSLKNGATDYVLKHKFSRLVSAVERALREARERRTRRLAEDDLRKSERRYRQLFEESKDAIMLSSLDGRLIDVNTAAIEMLGYSSKEEMFEIGAESEFYDTPGERARMFDLIERQGFVRGFETKLRRKDGTAIIVLMTVSPLRNEYGKVTGYQAISRDVTEQRKLEAQFLRAQRLESIGTLASGIAHDFNNILSPVLMAVQLLKLRLKDENTQHTLDMLETSARRGADLVKQILLFARGTESQRGPMQPSHLIRDVERMITGTFPKTIQLSVQIPKDLWLVHGDTGQLHQIMINLAVNARDAMSSGGMLKISASNVHVTDGAILFGTPRKGGEYIVLEVADTGDGIPEVLQQKIFEPFFTTKREGQGTGLGLATVKTIVTNHGGFVGVTSQPGAGTTFTVYLPALAAAADFSKIASATPAKTGHGELVLIVDDEAAFRNISKATLEAYGYRVLTAADGAEGLKLFTHFKDEVRVVLTDLIMPKMGGLRMAQSIQQIAPTKVVVMSGIAANENGTYGPEEISEWPFLHKPFTSDQLLQTLSSVLADSVPELGMDRATPI